MSTERVCQMKGKPADIVQCLREVIDLLESVRTYLLMNKNQISNWIEYFLIVGPAKRNEPPL